MYGFDIKLEHTSIKKCLVWKELLKDCYKFSTFINRINKWAQKIDTLGEKNIFYKKDGKVFKGDIFEIFCELLLKLRPSDDRIGIYDYHPVNPETDTGVDGYGFSINDGKIATVQIKYRIWDDVLNVIDDHLDNFRHTSFEKYKVDPKDKDKMLIITSGDGVHWKALDKMFSGKIRCISDNGSYGCLRGAQLHKVDSIFSLRTMTDNNKFFWDYFRKKVYDYDEESI